MRVNVEVYSSLTDYENGADPIACYAMNHNREAERRVLGQQCRYAFEAGQMMLTYPSSQKGDA